MEVGDIAPPVCMARRGKRPGARASWSVVLHPAEGMQPSKAGLYDEALVLDNRECDDLVPGLLRLAGPGPRQFCRSTSARR